jgi:hypothetical protein
LHGKEVAAAVEDAIDSVIAHQEIEGVGRRKGIRGIRGFRGGIIIE